MKLRISPPGTPMAKTVLDFAQYAANVLEGTEFIVMDRRTWERMMPTEETASPPQDEKEST